MTEMGNYRPISVIGHIAKIIEREIKTQMCLYLEDNDLITVDQSAYRIRHNTQTALHKVLDDWYSNMADGLLTAVCSFDIIKCFDTINHSILLQKMEKYGFHTNNVEWFRSYLLNRQQLVSCHNELSYKCKLDIGVPQGSVLGPVLFLLYVNDLNQHVDVGACNLYADDTLVYCTANNATTLQERTQKCVSSIKEWYDKNQLVINTSKSNLMLVLTKQREVFTNIPNIDVYLGVDRLTQLSCLDYLGVKLDAHLTWNAQINAVCKKLVFTISRLSRLKNVLAMHVLIYIYQSIVQPQLDYAITIWGLTSQLNISKVQRLQNRAARIITGNFDYVHVRGIDIVKQLKDEVTR